MVPTLMLKTAEARHRCITCAIHDRIPVQSGSSAVWKPEQQAELIRLLAENGAKLNQPDRGGVSPLHRAVRARSAAAVGQLLKSGAKVNSVVTKKGTTPLHLAVQSTGAGGTAGSVNLQYEIIELLLQYGADPNAKDSRGKTVFDWTTNQELLGALQTRRKQR
jgi:ankyrin repeat protein